MSTEVVDPWDEVFGDHAADLPGEGGSPTVAPAEAGSATAPTIPAESGAEASPAETPAEGGAESPAAGGSPGDAAPAEPTIEQLLHRIKSAEGRAVAFQRELEQLRQTQRPAAPAQVDVAPEKSPEDEFLETFRTKYNDDVLKAIEMVAERKAKSMLNGAVTPVAANVQQLMDQMHFSAIEAVHPDMREIAGSDELTTWIDSQPTHRQRAYRSIASEGSAREVIDLLSEFKDSRKKPAAAPAASALPASTTRPAQAAVAVPAMRGGLAVAPAAVATDFDSAWEEALRR